MPNGGVCVRVASAMSYAFLLGNHPELSLAELGSFFGQNVSLNPSNKIAFTENELPSQFVNPQDFLEVLGGTITLLKIFEERVKFHDLTNCIGEYIKLHAPHTGGKIPFAIDIYPEATAHSTLIKKLTIGVKKYLTKGGIRSEFWNNNFRNINRVYALKNGLLKKGLGIALIARGEENYMVCETVGLQNIENYALRDYGKAARDSFAGMLPPKLAQIMINLAIFNRPFGITFDESRRGRVTILDPFCGSGTVLMEGLLRGFSVMGSDISEKSVGDAQKNIAWLRESRNITPSAGAMIIQKSALEIRRKDCELICPDITSIAIVTEPLLGPPMREEPSDKVLEKVMMTLSELYSGFFKNMALWLPGETPIVCVFPCWRRAGGGVTKLSSRVVEKIMATGYSMPAYSPLHITSLLYSRPYSVVGREILRFVKK